MSIPPESIQVGQCYLSETGKVCRVTGVLPDQRVQFAWRNAASRRMVWRREVGIMSVADFARSIEHSVPCDWMVESNKAADAGSACHC